MVDIDKHERFESKKVVYTIRLSNYGIYYRVQYTATANDPDYSRLLGHKDEIFPIDSAIGYYNDLRSAIIREMKQ